MRTRKTYYKQDDGKYISVTESNRGKVTSVLLPREVDELKEKLEDGTVVLGEPIYNDVWGMGRPPEDITIYVGAKSLELWEKTIDEAVKLLNSKNN